MSGGVIEGGGAAAITGMRGAIGVGTGLAISVGDAATANGGSGAIELGAIEGLDLFVQPELRESLGVSTIHPREVTARRRVIFHADGQIV